MLPALRSHINHLRNLTGDYLHGLPLMVLYITDGCNSKCQTCDIWRNPRENMSLALVDKLVAEAAELGTRQVLLSGGEAMQHPQWDEIARRFRDAGVRVMMLTNGLLVKRQAERIAGCIDELIVSLDGATVATYQHIRGVDALTLVLDGIRAVSELGVPVITRTTVQQANFREMPQIIDAALDAGASSVSFLAVDVANSLAFGQRDISPENAHDPSVLSPAEIDELAQIIDRLTVSHAAAFAAGQIAESPEKLRRILVTYFRTLHGLADYPPPRCNAPHISAVFNVHGVVQPCYFLPAVGRLRQGEPAQDTLNAPAAQAMRAAYRSGQRRECAQCVCPLYKGPRDLIRM